VTRKYPDTPGQNILRRAYYRIMALRDSGVSPGLGLGIEAAPRVSAGALP